MIAPNNLRSHLVRPLQPVFVIAFMIFVDAFFNTWLQHHLFVGSSTLPVVLEYQKQGHPSLLLPLPWARMIPIGLVLIDCGAACQLLAPCLRHLKNSEIEFAVEQKMEVGATMAAAAAPANYCLINSSTGHYDFD